LIPLDGNVKDWLQALSWGAAAIGVGVAGLKFWTELALGREQRERDLRWRQAQAGKSLNDEMQTDPKAWPALQMLDSEERKYSIAETEMVTVSRADIRRALNPDTYVESTKDSFVRDCFDALFYFMAMIDHYVSTTLIREEDVQFPLEYYVRQLQEFQPEVAAYLRAHGLWRTQAYLDRHPASAAQRESAPVDR
jgi:hypothetical protein